LRTLARALIVAASISSLIHAQEVVLDRMLAIVNGDVVTLSDVRAARQLRLVAGTPGISDDQLVMALVERRLMLAEVGRSAVPEPSATQVAAQRAAWQATLPPGTDLAAALRNAGLKDQTLDAWLRADLRIAAYLDQRFNAVAQPTREQALTYYRAHESEFLVAGPGSVVAPFPTVEADVRKRVAADRRAVRIREWIDTLKQRAEIRLIK
jgi:hypothetical protein